MTDCKFKGHGHPASLTTQDIYRLKATAVEVSRASILIIEHKSKGELEMLDPQVSRSSQ